MNFTAIALALCAVACAGRADVAHLKAGKARLVGALLGRREHHKRGVLSAVPPFKLGHDIPLVSHSVVKPLVVTYPPTAAVTTVKVPLTDPFVPRYSVPLGHRSPVPHLHYGFKYPYTTKSVVLSKPDHHFHHHHHHLSPRPVVPVIPSTLAATPAPVPAPAPLPVPLPAAGPAAPFVSIAQLPSVPAVPHAAPLPPVLIRPAPPAAAPPVAVATPPVHVLPSNHLHVKPLLPAAVPVHPAPLLPTPLLQYAQQFPYVLRHGGAVQTSVFATYPRYPLLNYQTPFIPLAPSASAGHGLGQVLLNRPQVLLQKPQTLLHTPEVPQFHLEPQPVAHGGVVQHAAGSGAVQPLPASLQPAQAGLFPVPPAYIQPAAIPQTAVHFQPTQSSTTLDHEGWSPVTPQSHDLVSTHNQEVHFHQPHPHQHFTQEQGTQIYEHHTGDGQYDLHHQLQHHIQQQIEQAQYEQQLNNQQQLHQQYASSQQPGHEYGVPNQDFSQQSHDFAYHGQDYAPPEQQYVPSDQQYIQNDQNIVQAQQYVPQEQQFAQHDQQFAQQEQQLAQQDQQFSQQDQQFAQRDQQYSDHDLQYHQHDQQFSQHEHQYDQHGQEYEPAHQPAQQYGSPQLGAEGRNDDSQGTEQHFHNHIPLGLQPPIDEPLEHFR